MKSLSIKTLKRSVVYIKGCNVNQLEGIKASCLRSMQERKNTGKQFAVASFELKLINKLLS